MKKARRALEIIITVLFILFSLSPGSANAESAVSVYAPAVALRLQSEDAENPESMVVFSGNNATNAGYIPGETVVVEVRGPDGNLLICDALVNQSGEWSCSVNLWQVSRLLGTFYYQAKGQQSGVTFTGSFSNEGAVRSVDLLSDGKIVEDQGRVHIGSNLDVKITIDSSDKEFFWGSTKYQIQQQQCDASGECSWSPAYVSDCISQPDPDLAESVSNRQYLFTDLFKLADLNSSYYFMFSTYSDNACKAPNGNQWNFSNIFGLTANDTITKLNCIKTDDLDKPSYSCDVLVKYAHETQASPSGTVQFTIQRQDDGVVVPEDCVLTRQPGGISTCSIKVAADQAALHNLQARFEPGSDYDHESSSEWVSLIFEKAEPVVVVRANLAQKTYGEPDPELTFSASISGLPFSGSLERRQGDDAGSYMIGQGSLVSPGYKIRFIPGVLTVQKALPNIQVLGYTGYYDGEAHGPAITAIGIHGEGLSKWLELDQLFTDAPGGTSSWSFIGNRNYKAVAGYEVPVTISPVEVVVAADVNSKVYGDPDPAFTYSLIDGKLIKGDQITGTIHREPGENAGLHLLSQGTLSAGKNYQLTFVGSWFKIDPRLVTVTADPQKKVADSPDPRLTYRITEGQLVNGDMFNGSIARVPGNALGLYPIGQGTLHLSDNYLLNFKGASFSVFNPSVTFDADYDGLPNSSDNCVYMANTDQADGDQDGFGDACDPTANQLYASVIVPVTGADSVNEIGCSGDSTFTLESGDYVILPKEQCSCRASFANEPETSLPAPIPETLQFVSAVNLNLIKGDTVQDLIDGGGKVQFGLKLNTGGTASDMKILYWDPMQKQGTGNWIVLPAANTGEEITLASDEAQNSLTVYRLWLADNHQYVELEVNFTGLFVLAAKK